MVRITYVGAGFLAVVAIIPTLISAFHGRPLRIASFYGGTGLLIAVSVAFDLVQKIDSHLVMRNYRGLLGRAGAWEFDARRDCGPDQHAERQNQRRACAMHRVHRTARAGKGTQAERLAENSHMPHLSTGEMLRASERAKTRRWAMQAEQLHDAGKLVPDESLSKIMLERLDAARLRRRAVCSMAFPDDGPGRSARRDTWPRGTPLDLVLRFACRRRAVASALWPRARRTTARGRSANGCSYRQQTQPLVRLLQTAGIAATDRRVAERPKKCANGSWPVSERDAKSG